jgi:hypothetical protein
VVGHGGEEAVAGVLAIARRSGAVGGIDGVALADRGDGLLAVEVPVAGNQSAWVRATS